MHGSSRLWPKRLTWLQPPSGLAKRYTSGHSWTYAAKNIQNCPLTNDGTKVALCLGGDIVKDEDGFYAVFSEQGTSASHMAAAKFLDAIARSPDCDGEDSDAVGAYTQCMLGGEETWISLPPSRRPASWSKFREPVCRLVRNLYGHPKAGLF